MIKTSVLRVGGVVTRDGQELYETYHCGHCQRAMKVATWRRKGGMCRGCEKPVCFPCGVRMQTRGCESIRRLIDTHADRLDRLRKEGS